MAEYAITNHWVNEPNLVKLLESFQEYETRNATITVINGQIVVTVANDDEDDLSLDYDAMGQPVERVELFITI